jgi:hypothetical protein
MVRRRLFTPVSRGTVCIQHGFPCFAVCFMCYLRLIVAYLIGRSGKLLLPFAGTVSVGFGPSGTHVYVFVLSKIFTYSEMGPPLQQEEGSDYYCRWLFGCVGTVIY